jgi:hypothetical protein
MRKSEPPLDPEFAEMAAHSALEAPAALPVGGINYERLYTYRFRGIDQAGGLA